MAQDTSKVELQSFRISDISSAIEETNQAIQLAKSKFESAGSLDDIMIAFRELQKTNTELRQDTSIEKRVEASLTELDAFKRKWEKYQGQVKDIDNKLTNLNHLLDDFIDQVNKYEERWKLTSDEAALDSSFSVIQGRIESMVFRLGEQRGFHKTNSDFSYKLLDSITQENSFISGELHAIKVVYDEKKDMIFIKDSPSFRNMISVENDSITISSQIWNSWHTTAKENREFFRQNKTKMYFHFLLFLIIIWLFIYMKKELVTMEKQGNEVLLFDSKILKSPLALSFLITLTLSFWYYSSKPALLSEQLLFLVVIPVTWVLYGVVGRDYRLALIMVSVLYFMEQIQQLMVGQILAQRWILMLEGIAALVFSIYLSRPKSIIYDKQKMGLGLIKFFPVIPIILGVAVYANYNGSVLLSRIITGAIVKSAAAGIVLYMFVSTIEGLIVFLMASPLKERIHVFKLKSDKIRSWSRIILRTWAIYTWISLVFRLLQIGDSFGEWWIELMAYGWEFGEVSLTVDLLVNFSIIIIIFSAVANLSRTLLEVELLPRFNLKKGIPMAIAVVTRYFILVLGFFMAVAAAGIDLDKLGFLAGALGVGIGFGLQNVVGNFVSGLILIFERPIHIDDVIVTENIEGVVKEVGIRASKIRSWDGAEVIVPNMDLISRQVTNWTLSDTKRRREIILKLEYGSDPNKVIELINGVLDKNEEVLKEPPSMILFLGYQEYSIDFRVLFWLSGNMLQASSDVTLAIHNELKREEIKVAIPKQRMIWDDEKSNPLQKDSAKKAIKKPNQKSASKSIKENDKDQDESKKV